MKVKHITNYNNFIFEIDCTFENITSFQVDDIREYNYSIVKVKVVVMKFDFQLRMKNDGTSLFTTLR